MADTGVEIPDRDLFKASEVCELASVQSYVLRSWELEFPTLGHAKSAGAPRTYRRADVERVLRIKHLVFAEGLTLAGARRRIEDEDEPGATESRPAPAAAPAAAGGGETRVKLEGVKRELRSLLELLGGGPVLQPAASWPPRVPEQPALPAFDAEAGDGTAAVNAAKKAGGRKKIARTKDKSE